MRPVERSTPVSALRRLQEVALRSTSGSRPRPGTRRSPRLRPASVPRGAESGLPRSLGTRIPPLGPLTEQWVGAQAYFWSPNPVGLASYVALLSNERASIKRLLKVPSVP